DVLILERLRLAWLRRPEHFRRELVVNRGKFGAIPREEARDRREAVRDRRRGRGLQIQGRALAGDAIEAGRGHAAASDGPQLVGQVLLDERYLRLHRELDVRQRARAGPRRDTRKDPGGALLVHEATRSIDRVYDDRPV